MPEFHENGTKIEGMAMRLQQVDGEYRVVLSEEAMKAQRWSVGAEDERMGSGLQPR